MGKGKVTTYKITPERIQKYFRRIISIYIRSFEYYVCLKSIVNHPTTQYTDDRFLRFLAYTSWYIMVVEISKITQESTNQKYNLRSFLKKCLENFDELALDKQITKEEISAILERWKDDEFVRILTSINNLRNKFYAHTDEDSETILKENNVSFNDMELVFYVIRETIVELYLKFIRNYPSFENVDYNKFESIFVKIDNATEAIMQREKDEYEARKLENFERKSRIK